MVVPIFNTMMRIDRSLIEAARDAGASGAQILWNVILPLTKPGIMIGTIFVVTLVMGDALAIALMKYRDFRPENFRDFHPGGKLGAQLSKVRDLMHAGDALPLVTENTPMSEALIEISQKGFGVAGAVFQVSQEIQLSTGFAWQAPCSEAVQRPR